MGTTPATPTGTRANVWSFLTAAVVLTALVLVVKWVLDDTKEAGDVATILGIVVPAFATIGAAMFGIGIAYNAGAKSGEAAGAAGKDQAVAAARRDLASAVTEQLTAAHDAAQNITTPITTALPSPAGTARFELAPGEAFTGDTLVAFDVADLRSLNDGLTGALAVCRAAAADGSS